VPSCPFGVVDLDRLDGKAHKCTLCYDRLKGGFEPACAKACPTDSIQFGELDELRSRAAFRLEHLHSLGRSETYLYGLPGGPGGELGGLNAFFLLADKPEVHNLPAAPSRGSDRVRPALQSALSTVAGLAALAAVFLFRGSR
jgi:formate dehydrogenase iron-sulfur subunit